MKGQRFFTALKLGASALTLYFLCLLSGCNETRPVALVYVEDPTESCQDGRKEFREGSEQLVLGGYLGKEGQICFVHACSRPHLIWAGPARQGQKVKAAFERAGQPCPCTTTPAPQFCGSDPAGAIALAQAWLNKREFKNYRRIVVTWSDLINDPCTAGGKQRVFADPLKRSWASAKADVHVFGLPAARHDVVRKAWSGCCLHLPLDTFEPEHLGLQAAPAL
jgi:hypothetical protein